MLDIHQIEQYYPGNLRGFRRFILREYLQYKILEIVFNGPHATKLVFLGGTCLRIVHGNQRFSEDLDFDNLLLSEAEFTEISANISVQLTEWVMKPKRNWWQKEPTIATFAFLACCLPKGYRATRKRRF